MRNYTCSLRCFPSDSAILQKKKIISYGVRNYTSVRVFSNEGSVKERKRIMSHSPEEHRMQQPQTQEETILAELEAYQQTSADLSDEQLEAITGGGLSIALSGIKGTYNYFRRQEGVGRMSSAMRAMQAGPSIGHEAAEAGHQRSAGVVNHLSINKTI
jgi:hypothetical protein